MGDNRWTRTSRHCYNTKQHAYRAVRTPGGKLVAQRVYKQSSGVKCGDSKVALAGLKHLKKSEYHRTAKRVRTVSRAYGGTLSGRCVRDRIVRAFLLEEQKAVKMVLATKK